MAGLPFAMPPLQMSSSATADMNSSGTNSSASRGDFVVNIGGSGTALQSATGGINWMLVAAGVAAWLLLRK